MDVFPPYQPCLAQCTCHFLFRRKLLPLSANILHKRLLRKITAAAVSSTANEQIFKGGYCGLGFRTMTTTTATETSWRINRQHLVCELLNRWAQTNHEQSEFAPQHSHVGTSMGKARTSSGRPWRSWCCFRWEMHTFPTLIQLFRKLRRVQLPESLGFFHDSMQFLSLTLLINPPQKKASKTVVATFLTHFLHKTYDVTETQIGLFKDPCNFSVYKSHPVRTQCASTSIHVSASLSGNKSGWEGRSFS